MLTGKKLVLIDGHSILNRAYYGVPMLTNASGLPTNAVYGFLNIMFKILEEEQPDFLAVAFDVHALTFRHLMYDGYKATRKPMPEELRKQVPVIKDVLRAMDVQILERAGLEADDILGTIAKTAAKDGAHVALVSGDRDLLQISDEKIKIRIPKTKMGKTEIEDYYPEDVRATYHVTPAQFIELKALMGDTADNIPGVPKIGEKTATELMVQYGSIDGIYQHIEEISKNSIRESLRENRPLADLSKELATIKIDADIQLDYEKSIAKDFYTPEAYQLFKQLEFKNFLSRFDTESQVSNEDITKDFVMCKSPSEFVKAASKVEAGEEIGLFVMQEKSTLAGVSLATEKGCFAFLFPVRENVQLSLFDTIATDDGQEQVKEAILCLSKVAKISTFEIKSLYEYMDQDTTDSYFDILIGAYLLNPLKNDYDVETIASEHMGLVLPGRKEVFGKGSWMENYNSQPEKIAEYLNYGAYVAYKCASILQKKLQETGMLSLMKDIEMPLSLVLYQMEREGVAVRKDELRTYGEALSVRISELEKSIHTQAGEEFNINSPKQLGEILFEKMGLPGGKKTKTGYSTAAEVLEKLDAPIVKDILEYRGLTKLKSTYAEGLSNYIEEDGRIHTNFNQTITATGRISSTEPNLQNIPMRMELGRRIRKVFVPKEGYLLMDADYSQIELRVLAHMSGDEQLCEAYHSAQDIHRMTASKVFHTPLEEVTDLQRRNAKAVNFGIVYGISSFGLSQDLSISRKEAAEYIDQYFRTYPKVKEFLDKLVEDAKRDGYITTMFGRRRPIPELSSSNFMQRSFGERVAMNSPIQGTAADIMKIAMIKVWEALKEANLKSKLILQVHDELVIETALDEVEMVREILEHNMKTAAKMAVELEVDLHTGSNWFEAH